MELSRCSWGLSRSVVNCSSGWKKPRAIQHRGTCNKSRQSTHNHRLATPTKRAHLPARGSGDAGAAGASNNAGSATMTLGAASIAENSADLKAQVSANHRWIVVARLTLPRRYCTCVGPPVNGDEEPLTPMKLHWVKD